MPRLGDNYIDQLAGEIASLCKLPDNDDYNRLARIYAVLCLTKGAEVTSEDVHDAWSAWCAENKPDHRSLVPFAQLTREVKVLDEPYRNAIRDIAIGWPKRYLETNQ
jgi:hypothetical protein